MTEHVESGRANQRSRTRKDLLSAAGRLLKQGRTPTMDDIAVEAQVSRATAYRYFPNVEELLVEAPIEGDFPDVARVLGASATDDPSDRVDQAEAAVHDMTYRNQEQLRVMLAASLDRRVRGTGGVPVRQNRRTGLIEAALEPTRHRLDEEAYRRLCAALSVYFGPEAMVVFADVLDVDPDTARRVKSWAVRALVRAALAESSETRGAGDRGSRQDTPGNPVVG